ncbi:MAG: hypothetical protein ACPHLK_03990 [Gammaproteobacteria bacterium]
MQQQKKSVAVEETEDSNLLDCYRIAVDFGMSAALKAYEKLATDTPEKLEHDNNANSI